jgi:hypothetical protein
MSAARFSRATGNSFVLSAVGKSKRGHQERPSCSSKPSVSAPDSATRYASPDAVSVSARSPPPDRSQSVNSSPSLTASSGASGAVRSGSGPSGRAPSHGVSSASRNRGWHQAKSMGVLTPQRRIQVVPRRGRDGEESTKEAAGLR